MCDHEDLTQAWMEESFLTNSIISKIRNVRADRLQSGDVFVDDLGTGHIVARTCKLESGRIRVWSALWYDEEGQISFDTYNPGDGFAVMED